MVRPRAGRTHAPEVNKDYKREGKLAVVTAAAHGIGEATANLLASEGAAVFAVDVDAEGLERNGGGWQSTFVGDLSSEAGVRATVDALLAQHGRAPDILVNNVGVADQEPFATLSDAQWQRSHDLNLMSCVRMCRALLPAMAKAGNAVVISVSSDLAKQPEPMPMEYGVAKAGLLYLTKALSKDYAPAVRVNAVCPGPVWTRLWSRPGGIADQLAAKWGLAREAALQRYLEDRYMPMGFGQPEDVAQAIAFLASPVSKAITGATIDICGTLRGLT